MACDWLLIDGSSMIFRAFYGVPASVRGPGDQPINAIRGFLDALARLIVQRRPRQLAVASDQDWRPQWRVELIPSYKAHRVAEPVPPLLEPQMAVIFEILSAIGVDHLGVADHEAEDVIATWSALTAGTVEVVSGDRDLFALVEDPRVRVLYPETVSYTHLGPFQASAQRAEPMMKMTKPASYIRTRPNISPSRPTCVASSVITSR